MARASMVLSIWRSPRSTLFPYTTLFRSRARVRYQLERRNLIEQLRELNQSLEEKVRSEEHTSELQSRQYLVCRLLLEKNKGHCSRYCRCAPSALRVCTERRSVISSASRS